jgi:hypothetical protein
VASAWHNKLARLFRADWKEIRTRGGQEFHKRADLLRYSLGGKPYQTHVPPGTSHATSQGSQQAKFFFAPAEAAVRADLLRQHLPAEAATILREADDICQHRLRLLGYENLGYGPEIDWHLDRVHGKRAPLDPWFKIPFLDFNAVGDHKVTWELNRHQHLVVLAKAWLLAKDEKYLRELVAQWRSWTKSNPYPVGINWGSTLEVAFRSLSWIWVDHLLADAPAYQEFRAELLPALDFHGRYIERYLSTYFSPNTHLLGEALAMFFIGTLYPEFPRASRWRDEGWKILLHEAQRQVRPDGVYFEQSLHYHVYALDFFLHARLLAEKNEIAVPSAFDEVVRRMLDVVEALAQAGPAEGFGDDDGGRLSNSRRNRTEHMSDPLAPGATIYNRNFSAAQLTEESIWLFGERAITKLEETQKRDRPGARAFLDGGLYVLASPEGDAELQAQAMMIDAGPQGIGRCGHGHADALSLRLTMSGSRWLVDSGSGVYISRDPAERNALRGTAAHNTLSIDGADQAIPDEPFSWKEIPTTRVESWVTGRTFTYFAGSHNGYERLSNPVTHRRCVLRLDAANGDSFWLVRDVALGRGEHDLELNWHFASDVELREIGDLEFSATRPEMSGPSLRLLMPNHTEWSALIASKQISPAYGRVEPAPAVQAKAHVNLPTEIATVLVSAAHAASVEAETSIRTLTSTQHPAVQLYELRDHTGTWSIFFARDKQPWSVGPWSSDAEALCARINGEKLEQLVVIGGSSVAWQGEPLFNASAPFQFFEWRRNGELVNSAQEKFSTTPAFEELKSSLLSLSSVSHPTSTYAEKR